VYWGSRSAARANYARNEYLGLEDFGVTDRLAQMQVSQQPGCSDFQMEFQRQIE